MAKYKTPASRAQKGETLAEVMVALLIVALAALLMASIVSVAAHLNTTTRQKDEKLYAALGQIERLDGGTEQKDGTYHAVIEFDPADPANPNPAPVEVDVYSSEGLTFYKHKEP